MLLRTILFLLLNFGALAIGSLVTAEGVPSEWYTDLNKAPWTPPGWVFGAAWTVIMVAFSLYMAYLWPLVKNQRNLIGQFALLWTLNVAWNPVFFALHQVGLGLIVISLLTLLVGVVLYRYWPMLKLKSLLLAPYVIWLIVATSLNAYILFNN